jgi:hypothetical protein
MPEAMKPIVFFFLMLSPLSCTEKPVPTLRPQGLQSEQTVTLEIGDLRAVFADNRAFGERHRAGYNGIAELRHRAQDSSAFVPAYAGFNLEHIFGGDSLERLFEPREHPMELFRSGAQQVQLYQAPTPLSGVESLSTFTLSAPHSIDVAFQCIFHNPAFFRHGYAGLFWASYIDTPPDKKIYFRGTAGNSADTVWIAAWSERHGEASTHPGLGDRFQLYYAPDFNVTLAGHLSGYRYAHPVYYGRFHNMVLAFFFDSDLPIRFSQSPTGGGPESPAWDFHWIIPEPEYGKIYSFRARMVYKPFAGEEDVAQAYGAWIGRP